MNIILERISDDGVETLGHLHVDTGTQTIFSCDSIERPWKDNEHQTSCIPIATYEWVKVGATAHIPYTHISILNVPDRLGICIHRSNFYSDLLGCIAVGVGGKDINGDGELDVASSTATFDKMMSLLPDIGKLIIIKV